MEITDQNEVKFGPFLLNRRDRRVTREGIEVAMGSRALDVLACLAASPGTTVSKDQLLDQVWPSQTVARILYRYISRHSANRWVRAGLLLFQAAATG